MLRNQNIESTPTGLGYTHAGEATGSVGSRAERERSPGQRQYGARSAKGLPDSSGPAGPGPRVHTVPARYSPLLRWRHLWGSSVQQASENAAEVVRCPGVLEHEPIDPDPASVSPGED